MIMNDTPPPAVTLMYRRKLSYNGAISGDVFSYNALYIPQVGEEIDITFAGNGPRKFVQNVVTGVNIGSGTATSWAFIVVGDTKPVPECTCVSDAQRK